MIMIFIYIYIISHWKDQDSLDKQSFPDGTAKAAKGTFYKKVLQDKEVSLKYQKTL